MINNDQMNELQLEDVEDYSADYPPVGFPNAEENMAPMGNSEEMNGQKSPKYRRSAVTALVRNNKWSIAVLGVVVIVLIGVMAAAVGKEDAQPVSADTSELGVPPTTVDVASVDQDVLSVLKTSVQNVYDHHTLDKSALEETAGMTPQRQAMLWMASDINVNSEEHTEKFQRFVLAVLFYATNMVPNDQTKSPQAWLKADRWMSTAHSCDWMGVICNDDKVIVSIDLERNRLSGSLPVDLVIIGSKLESLDFTSNDISMSGSDFNLFRNLPVLKTLLMDDNYLYHDQGLPQQFRHLTNLQKLRLSYNLFEGKLESGEYPVLGALSKLTHLEIESNFITGTMPSAIGSMSQLVYFYMRRNEMSFNLDFLKTGQLVNLFAMWLDANNVTGSIPTEIGLCTGLASLSITNSSLTGPIPDTFGNLVELRRVWLYNNQLSGDIPDALNNLPKLEILELHHNKFEGSVPDGVCNAIDQSDYEYKSFTVDCKVSCPSDCCTQCF